MFREKIILYAIASAIFLSTFFNLFNFHYIEFLLYDLRFRHNPIKFVSSEVKVVHIKKSTNDIFSGRPQISHHVKVLKELKRAKPKSIYYMIDPKNIKSLEEDQVIFKKEALGFSNIFFYSKQNMFGKSDRELDIGDNFTGLKYTRNTISIDLVSFATDGVSRRVFLGNEFNTSSERIIAELFNSKKNASEYRGYFKYGLFKNQLHDYTLVRFQPKGVISSTLFEDVYDGNFDLNDFKDKVVLVGFDDEMDTSDYIKTVFQREGLAMSLAEANANVIATLIHDKGIIKTGFWVNFPFTLVFAVIVALGVFALTPIQGIFLALGALIAICFISWFLFVVFGVAIGTIYPILTVFSIYYLFVPYRLIQETKKNLEAQKELQLARVTAKSAKVDLGFRIATQVAHDLKSPLMALMTVKSVGQETVKPELLDLLGRSIDKIDQITKELLKKFGRGSFEFQNKDVSQNLTTIIKNVIKSQSQIYPNSRFEFVGTTEDILIDIQGAEIERALNNLVINAVEASHSKAQVQILIEKTQESVLVSVIDKGPGIPPHIQDQIFKPGFTFGKKTGTGIGLAQVQDAVSNNGGTIRLVSSRSGETVFQMTFPLKKQGNLKLLISDNALVIEDSVDTQAIWEDIFTNQGINFKIIKNYRDFESEYTSTNGKFFGDKEFTVITDLVFEGEDLGGFDVLEKFKSAKNNLFKNAYVCTSLSGNQEIVKIAKNYDCEVIGKQDILGLEIVKS